MKNKYISVKIKLFVPIILTFLIFFITLYFFNSKLIDKNCKEMISQQIFSSSQTILNSISYAMLFGKQNEITKILSTIKTSPNIISISITDLKGNVFKSTNSNIKKINLSDVPLKEYSFVALDKYYRSYNPILNKSECHRCHGSTNEYLGFIISEISMENIINQKHQLLNNVILLALLVCLTAALLIIFLINSIIIKPIDNLKASMEAMKASSLNVLLKTNKNDEIGSLINGYNQMIINLNTLYKEIENLHQKEIQKAGQIALVGELTAGLAHEIKNPLAGISNVLDIIKDQLQDKESKQILLEANNEIARINKIIQELLLYAKPKELEKTKIEINQAISQAITHAQHNLFDKNIIFEFSKTETINLMADQTKLEQVFINLFLNSIQAIKEVGKITIKVSKEDDQIIIQISDNGEGIHEDKLGLIFQPFYTTKPKGTGLGLSISKQIIEQHGGSIKAESTYKQGATFYIALPRGL